VSTLAQAGGWLGGFSLHRESLFAAQFAEIFSRSQPSNSIVNASVVTAVNYDFGNAHHPATAGRTSGSQLFINVLMSMYFAFRLDVRNAQHTAQHTAQRTAQRTAQKDRTPVCCAADRCACVCPVLCGVSVCVQVVCAHIKYLNGLHDTESAYQILNVIGKYRGENRIENEDGAYIGQRPNMFCPF
jgi:hypothetical protein